MSDKVTVRVIGPLEVAGVATGRYVDLDPDLVNIDALVEGGHIELSDKATDQPAEAIPEGGVSP